MKMGNSSSIGRLIARELRSGNKMKDEQPAPTTRETADHEELARLAEAAAPYWHAANLACGGNPIAVDLVAPFVGAMSPAVCSALLSEIAALRGEHKLTLQDGSEAWCSDAAWRWFQEWAVRLEQAERQRDEAVGLLRDVVCPGWTRRAWSDARAFLARLANQGADQ